MAFRVSVSSECVQISTIENQEMENEILDEKSWKRRRRPQQHNKYHHELQHQQKQEKKMSFGVQMLLVASLFGLEMAMALSQIYQVLFMQFLGVPTSLLSMNGVICGACSMCILPVVGCCVDRGPNPKMRKMFSLYIGMGMFLLAMINLFICGVIRLYPNKSLYEMINATVVVNDNSSSIDEMSFLSDNSSSDEPDVEITIASSYVTSGSSSVTITATLSLLAFSFNDMGFDMSSSLTRAYVLECLPASQHTKILILGTTAQSFGGMAFCCFGLFDLPFIFRKAFGVDGTAATILFLSSLLFVTTLVSFMSTTITGYLWNLNINTNDYVEELRPDTDSKKNRPLQPFEPDVLQTEESSTSTSPLQSEDSLEESSYLAKAMNTSKSFEHKFPENVSETNEKSLLLGPSKNTKYDNRTSSEPAIGADNHAFDETGTEKQETWPCESLLGSKDQTKDLNTQQDTQTRGGEGSRPKMSLDKRLLAVVVSEFFACGTLLTMGLYAANALTVGILGGKPNAPQASEGRLRYENGLRIAALGNLIHYIAYFTISVNNKRIVDRLGPKLQSVVCHLALIVMTLILVITESMPIYFLTMGAAGLYRPCVLTVPFLLANTYARDIEAQESPKTSHPTNIGKVMSLLGFQMPFHYLILSCATGPMLDATGNAFSPLMYSTASAIFSLLTFSSLFLMKNS